MGCRTNQAERSTMGDRVPKHDFRGKLCDIPCTGSWRPWDPPQTCGMEAGARADRDGTRNVAQGVNLPDGFRYQIAEDDFDSMHKFTNDNIQLVAVHYSTRYGLTLSFLSLISRGSGGLQKRKRALYSKYFKIRFTSSLSYEKILSI